MPKISTPKVVILLEQAGTDELIEYTVQADNRDMVRFDMARSHRRWPSMTDAPILWLTFLAWAALKRAGVIDKEEFDTFNDRCVEVRDANKVEAGDDAQEDEPGADPTQ